MPLKAALYARVSTNDQDAETQLRELRQYVERRGWSLVEEFVDHGVSGSKTSRPALNRLMKRAQRRDVDVIVVWALDRLGRSLSHLVALMDQLGALGVDLAVLTQPIDTTTPTGKLTFQILGAVAEFERSMIRSRVRAGVAKARAQGKALGRPRADLDLDLARARLETGDSLRKVARVFGVHHSTLKRALARERGAKSPSPSERSVVRA
tara:strand:- start:1383 stop:2009 length:627 start_codon:yes stop_codon:yes gene_type:complete